MLLYSFIKNVTSKNEFNSESIAKRERDSTNSLSSVPIQEQRVEPNVQFFKTITPAGLIKEFQSFGLEEKKGPKLGAANLEWRYEKQINSIHYYAGFSSSSPDSIVSIGYAITYGSKKQATEALEFLKFGIGLSKDDTSREKAQQWLELNFDKETADTIVNGYAYSFASPPNNTKELYIEKRRP